MSVEHGPSRSARTPCSGCGVFCLDEEMRPAIPGLPELQHCADCYEEIHASEGFTCCGHAQHLRRRVDDIVHAECIDCGHRWREFPIDLPTVAA